MNEKKQLIQHISIMMIARAAFRGLTALAFLASYRYFTKDQQGMLDTAINWTNAVMTLSDLGMSTLILKHASQEHKRAAVYFGNGMLIQVVMSFVIFALLLLAAFVNDFTPLFIALLALIAIAGLIFEWRKVIRNILRAQMRIKEIAWIEILNGVLFISAVLGIFAFIDNRTIGLLGFGAAQLFVNALCISILYFQARKLLQPAVETQAIPAMLRESIHFTLYNTFEMLYLQVNVIILSLIQSTAVVATYAGAARIATAVLIIPQTAYQIILPALYKYAKTDNVKYRSLASATLWGFGSMGVVAGCIFFFFADSLVPLILGEKYRDTIPVMQWLSIFIAFRMISIPLTNLLIARDHQKIVAYTQIFTVSINALLVVLLVPLYGPVGPAIATAGVETGNVCILTLLYWKKIGKPLRAH